jgi:hypothetical protein
MQFALKSISPQSIPEALAKVERYRLLNEPSLAESICLDILAIVPDQQQALISLLLARTDQFDRNLNAKSAQEVLSKITGAYERAYYAGIVLERMGHAHIHHSGLGQGSAAYHALRAAMSRYEDAAQFSPPGNEDAALRWNTCARVIMRNAESSSFDDDQPVDARASYEADSRIGDA